MSSQTVSDSNFKDTLTAADKPVLLDVWAPWCGPCKMVGPAVERLQEKQPERFQVVMANMEEFAEMAEQLQIKATPTLILFRDGEEIARRSGAMMESQISQWLDQNL